MRAKEFLNLNKDKFQFYNILNKLLQDLYPLRTKESDTRIYIENHLFADGKRRQADILHNEVYKESSDEISCKDALAVRLELLPVLNVDESFIISYNIIIKKHLKYFNGISSPNFQLKSVDNETLDDIRKMCHNYMEDYPRKYLSEYLKEDENLNFISGKKCRSNHVWWKMLFDKAYECFDELRVKASNPFYVLDEVQKMCTEDNKMNRTIMELMAIWFDRYDFDLDKDQIKMYRILSESLKMRIENKDEIYIEDDDIAVKVASESEIERLIKENEKLTKRNEKLTQENMLLREKIGEQYNTLNCSQQTMAFYYLFDNIGINTKNTKKSVIARFIHSITGRNETNIRKRLEFKYDDVNVNHNLRIVAEVFKDISPKISDQILKDIKG